MGVYQLQAKDVAGRVIDLSGTDPKKLKRDFIKAAKEADLMK